MAYGRHDRHMYIFSNFSLVLKISFLTSSLPYQYVNQNLLKCMVIVFALILY